LPIHGRAGVLERDDRLFVRPSSNWRYGTLGLLAVPTLLFEFVSPAFWLGGLALTIVAWAIGLLSTLYIIAFLVVSLGLSVVLSPLRSTSSTTGPIRPAARCCGCSGTPSPRSSATPS
jgi:hypothetical protein